MKVKYNSKEELIANLKLTIAKKNEYVAKVQRNGLNKTCKDFVIQNDKTFTRISVN